MTEPTPDQSAEQTADPAAGGAGHLPTDHRQDPPPSAAELLDERPPPPTEAQRQVQATVRSVSRLEESS